MKGEHEEQRARDALAFEPLPSAPWLSVTDSAIEIRVRYSETLSRLLRSLPSARWIAGDRCWRLPFSSGPAVRTAHAEISRLAALAVAAADEQTKRIKEEQRVAAERLRRAAPKSKPEFVRPRVLRPEYIAPASDRPKHTLALECIGDNVFPMVGLGPREWVAQIFGIDECGRFVRSYIRGNKDYTTGNSQGSRGVYRHFILSEGPIYEVCAPMSWKRSDRYFLRYVDGEARKMTAEEVRECLEK